MEKWHRSVLLEETVSALGEIKGGRFADLTFGEGGHAEELLKRGAAEVIGVDRDREAIARYLEGGGFRSDPRLKILRARDENFKTVVANTVKDKVWPLLEAGKIAPVISATFPLTQAAEAHRLMESSKHIGKIILKIE